MKSDNLDKLYESMDESLDNHILSDPPTDTEDEPEDSSPKKEKMDAGADNFVQASSQRDMSIPPVSLSG